MHSTVVHFKSIFPWDYWNDERLHLIGHLLANQAGWKGVEISDLQFEHVRSQNLDGIYGGSYRHCVGITIE